MYFGPSRAGFILIMTTEKLQKLLAAKGLGSRRAMEGWIAEGRVLVNDKVASLGDRVDESDIIKVDGKILNRRRIVHRYLLYNKPAGEICSVKDPENRPSVFRRLPRLRTQRWISVGRLDFNTTGLLLFTTDGELANRLMHPSYQIEREYAVRVLGEVSDAALQRMREGVLLEDGVARFTDIQRGRGEGANQWYYVVMMEGRNREVRRLWESQGYQVSRLKRVRYGSIFMPSKVKAGRHIDLSVEEVRDLYKLVGLASPL